MAEEKGKTTLGTEEKEEKIEGEKKAQLEKEKIKKTGEDGEAVLEGRRGKD